MDHIFDHANDQHIRGTYVYAKASDAYAYANAGKTVKINASTLHDLFLRGAIVVDVDVEYMPVSFGLDDGVGTLTYVKTNATTATTAVLATVSSSEYDAQT